MRTGHCGYHLFTRSPRVGADSTTYNTHILQKQVLDMGTVFDREACQQMPETEEKNYIQEIYSALGSSPSKLLSENSTTYVHFRSTAAQKIYKS